MSATTQAKATLEAATLNRECQHNISRRDCKACRKYLRLRSEKQTYAAKRAISRLGFTPATLGVAIKLAEALIECPPDQHDGGCSAGISRLPCKCSHQYRAKALAEWADLFPKEADNE